MMKVAFVCDTPYQCLNALNLFWNTYMGRKDVLVDLYIVDQFKNARGIYERICRKKLFHNVYFLRREKNRTLPQGLKRSLLVAYSYLNTTRAVRNQFDGEVPRNKYDAIYSAVMTCFISALVTLNPKAEFMLFDDGTGSYSGDIIANGGGAAYKLFSKLTGRGAEARKATKLFVNNPSMCKSTAAEEVCQMPPFEQDFLDVAYEVFGVEKREGKLSGIVLLTHPSQNVQLGEDMRNIVSWMRPYQDKTLVRPHPRDTDLDLYDGFALDTKGEMWELMISQMDMDRILLMASYSTAQVTPKLLYDKEPWLVFTYHLATASSEESKSRYDLLVKELSDTYRNKHRIMVPNSVQELSDCLKKFIDQEVLV